MIEKTEKKVVIEGKCSGINKAYAECAVEEKCCYIPLAEIEISREQLPPEDVAEYRAELEAANQPFPDGWDCMISGTEIACDEMNFKPGKRYRITIEELD
jgi:hypothetical protein